MQIPDIATAVSPAKAYVYKGLSVQGASPTRLTPYPNPNIMVPDEVGRAIVLRNLARRLIGSEIAIARVGLGLRPAAHTVSAHVQAATFFSGLARKVASSPEPLLTPKPAHLSNIEGAPGADVGKGSGGVYLVDEEVDMPPAEGEVEL